MDTVTLNVGTVRRNRSGHVTDSCRPVEFVGELVASRTVHTGNDDTRGVSESLYKTDDGRLVVYVEDWSRWQGEPSVYSLREVAEADLQPGGRYEMLGYEAGYGRPLTLDEALNESRDAYPEE